MARTVTHRPRKNSQLNDWLTWVGRLVSQIRSWSEAQGWAIHEDIKIIEEPGLGQYEAPFLRIRTPQGELHVSPIARLVLGGADGRVDLESWPTLRRVLLLRKKGKLQVMTDSGVPLRQAWNRRNFIRLAEDLTL